MSIFTAPAYLTRIAFLKDKGLSLGFVTQELPDADKLIVSRFHGSFGHVLFSENQLKEEDVPKGDATDDSKTPSQRLRGVLFIYWKQLGSQGDFDQFYRAQLELMIDNIKRKLD